MQTYKIDNLMDNFSSTKATLDAKVNQYKQDHRKHMTGIVRYYSGGDLDKIEYVYSFSTEPGIEE